MQRTTYRLVDLAPDLEACEVAAWHAAPGAPVAEGDDLLDIVTDKANITIPAPARGRVVSQHAAVGAVIHAADAVVTLQQE